MIWNNYAQKQGCNMRLQENINYTASKINIPTRASISSLGAPSLTSLSSASFYVLWDETWHPMMPSIAKVALSSW